VRLEGGQSLLFCQDITERILAGEELRRANERLVQAESRGGSLTEKPIDAAGFLAKIREILDS